MGISFCWALPPKGNGYHFQGITLNRTIYIEVVQANFDQIQIWVIQVQ
jgi:hypothetical protein